MNKIFKIIGYVLAGLIGALLLVFLFLYVKSSLKASKDLSLLGEEAQILTVDNVDFRDLNKNGKLDIYEDVRVGDSSRVENLLQQMNMEEKAGLMFITMAAMESDGALSNTAKVLNPMSLMLESNVSMVASKNMNHFNTLQSLSPEAMIDWNNNVQKIAERTRLGIPVTLATDPRHGVENATGQSIYTAAFSGWCSTLGLAAIGDTVLAREFGDIARQEYLALGFRLSLSPMADLGTEPRWGRFGGTFGEDAHLAAKMTKAYILGFQGDSIGTESVECMVKHFSGGGPQKDGLDAHFPPGFQNYEGDNFDYHLIPFEEGAFAANAAQVMPYYGIPLGQTSEDVGFGYNKEIITGLLRDKYHFDGIVCTDWGLVSDIKIMGMMFKPASAHGVEHLNVEERVQKIINAGCDMFGGEAMPEVIVNLVESGKIDEERLDTSVRRILKEKFKLGLFDNPYLDQANASILNSEVFREKGLESQRRSLTLLKNDNDILPLSSTMKVYLQGFNEKESEKYASMNTSLEDADVILLKVNTPDWGYESRYLMENFFHQGRLDFPEEEKLELLTLINSKPTVLVVNLERPAIFPEINEASSAVLADFSSRDDVILDVIFGEYKPEGKLPFELPSSMEAVLEQKEDVPYDSKEPLYKFGDGLTY